MNHCTFPVFLLLLAPLTLVNTGCQSSTAQRDRIPTEVTTDAPAQGRPTLGVPLQLPESDVFVVPFTIDRPRRWLEDADQFELASKSSMPNAGYFQAEAFGSIGLTRSVRWHNAVVQKKGGQGTLVLSERGLISKFEVVGHWIEVKKESDPDEKELRFVPKGVLFLATVQDMDKDKQLTSQDANVLIAGDTQGGGLHPITPANTQVWSTRYNAELNLVLIMVASDTNGDGLFTAADSAAPYLYQPGDAGMARPLVDPSIADRAERLLK